MKKKYSVVIPTMWKSNLLTKSLDRLQKSEFVDEIIVIDNNKDQRNVDLSIFDKVVHLEMEQNIFVNPAWNLGVKTSKNELVVISSDDVDYDPSFLEFLNVNRDEIIGLHEQSFSQKVPGKDEVEIIRFDDDRVEILELSTRTWGWAVVMIFNKSDYVEIPEQIKIWCGDDILFDSFKTRLALRGYFFETQMSTTCDNIGYKNEFDRIKGMDCEYKRLIFSK